jgi:hypothetical protein
MRVERSRKACGIAALRAKLLAEKPGIWVALILPRYLSSFLTIDRKRKKHMTLA